MHQYPSDTERSYSLVEPSPWPILSSLAALTLAIGAVVWLAAHKGEPITVGAYGAYGFYAGLAGVLAIMWLWWRDVIREALQSGFHTPRVRQGIRYGMMLFIFSEVMFFVAWFWAFFNSSIFPVDLVQYMRTELFHGVWPPKGIEVINPWKIPLINTIILLSSGGALGFAHHALMHDDRGKLKLGLILSIALGVLFIILQGYEFITAPFVFSFDPRHPSANNYGSVFFMATGFHGAHVIIGAIFLSVCLARVYKGHFSANSHLGFEFAAWYWHFVDAVWLFLFCCIYVWGNWGGAME